MKDFFKKYPVPISGIALGLVTLGNLLRSYGEIYRNVSGFLASVILILLLIKIVINFQEFKKELENPLIAGSFATFSMALIVLSTYIGNKEQGFFLWISGIIVHTALIIWFTSYYLPKRNIKTVFTTWFIVYVGIVTISVTAPAYKLISVGQTAFWFGFISYLILLPIVCYRVFVIKNIPEPALPTFSVFAAPAALLLAGYISSFPEKNLFIFYFLIFLTVFFYILVITSMPKLLKLKFYPSFSAFTFPLAISGLALKLAVGFIKNSGGNPALLRKFVIFGELTAIFAVAYVLIKYFIFLFKKV
ncbi:TDT family transporter [Leptotrichia sp. OH3620_COT-345]|uniref:TDT family transporter n=1 Tax=Leptotrichia sp. OH3620_COT-345 TaxID=2491048 RepID=UPI000F64CCD0|nr:TDT family transporter [Leptotrichia sp. OH3620_COT-345]RRD39638.1 TDT family transporter [Leptotrichia sp. OH3620_COT-345]